MQSNCSTEVWKWGYHNPAKHGDHHRTSDRWELVDMTADNGEILLACFHCRTYWHTGLADNDDYYSPVELKRAAAKWLRDSMLGKRPSQQLVMAFAQNITALQAKLPGSVGRAYRKPHRADMSNQLLLFAA